MTVGVRLLHIIFEASKINMVYHKYSLTKYNFGTLNFVELKRFEIKCRLDRKQNKFGVAAWYFFTIHNTHHVYVVKENISLEYSNHNGTVHLKTDWDFVNVSNLQSRTWQTPNNVKNIRIMGIRHKISHILRRDAS